MGDSNNIYKVEKLSQDNYNSWAYRMKMLLIKEELWNVVNGSEKTQAGDTEEITRKNEEILKKMNKAQALIALSVDDLQLLHVKNTEDPHTAWQNLKEANQSSTVGAKVRLLQKFFETRYTKDGNMREHLNRMMAILDQLTQMDFSLDETVAVSGILASVSKEYGGLVTALEAWDDSKINLKSVKNKLIDEWEKRTTEVKRTTTHWENTAKEENKERKSSEASSSTVLKSSDSWQSSDGYICHNCRKPGHFRKDCPMPDKKRDFRHVLNKKAEIKKVDSANMARDAGDEMYENVLLNVKEENSLQSSWIIDSGATTHMCGNFNLFSEISKIKGRTIYVADGSQINAHGIGSVPVIILSAGTELNFTIRNVLWAPDLKDNIVSVQRLVERGYLVKFGEKGCSMSRDGKTTWIGTHHDGLYKLNKKEICYTTKGEETLCLHEWHRHFAHRNLDDIRLMKRQGLVFKPCTHSDVCESCLKGKMARKPFPKEATRTKDVLDCVVSDICGPMQVESASRKRYFVTFIDVHTKYSEVRFLRTKDEVQEESIWFIERIKTRFGRKPKVFRSDRGLEYLNDKLQTYLKREGIKSECTVGYAPEQNGIAERKNRTLMEAARSMLVESTLPKMFWAEAVNYANYAINRVSNRKTQRSPLEEMYGMKPNLKYLHDFGSDVYVMIPDERRRKLDDKARKMKFLGRDEASKGYRLVDENYKVHVSREVEFVGTKLPFRRKRTEHNVENGIPEAQHQEFIVCWNDNSLLEQVEEPAEEFFDAQEAEDSDSNGEESEAEEVQEEQIQPVLPVVPVQQELQPVRRSTRTNFGQPPSRFSDFVSYCANINNVYFEPRNHNEAMQCKNSHYWKLAELEELNSLEENNTWELVDLPYGRKAIGSKWVYKLKMDENKCIVRWKGRLVAQGFSQKYGIDYDEVFAPTARPATLRLLLSVAGRRKYYVNHYDIKTAFLNGTLEEEIYLKQPPGYEQGSKVYRLYKSLYGLKQAARVWNQTLHEALEAIGFKQNQTDRCLYAWKKDGRICYVLIHVDDLLVAGNDQKLIEELMGLVGSKFEIKNLGGVKHYLGIDIERDSEGRFMISQPSYIAKIVQEAGLDDAKKSKFPLDTGYVKQEGKLLESNEEYRKLIGMLLYLTTHSRPDIAASVSILSKKVETPRDNDLNEVKRVIRYLIGTQDLKLVLNEPDGEEVLHAYSDANWAEDRNDRKSNSGYFCSINGGAISWCSRKQDIVALSSAESEYVALTETCKEVTWLKELSKGFDITMMEPITIYTDSQSCISMIKNQKFSNRSKHIDTRYHYIRDQVGSGYISLKYCPTAENTADLFTKPLGGIKTETLRKQVGLRRHPGGDGSFRHSEVEEVC